MMIDRNLKIYYTVKMNGVEKRQKRSLPRRGTFEASGLRGFEASGLRGFDDENATFVPIFRNATPATTDIEASSTPNVWLIGVEKTLYKTPKKTHPKSTLKNVARKLQYPTKIS